MAEPIHLHHVYDYTDVDRAFWTEHIEGWLPQRVADHGLRGAHG